MRHHEIDIDPVLKDQLPIFINEMALIDDTVMDNTYNRSGDIEKPDNIRIYDTLDLNADAIIRRLNAIVSFYGEATEENEFNYSIAVSKLISQLEIYDQIWNIRKPESELKHSTEAVELVNRFVAVLEKIQDGCAEIFPFDIIEELRSEYL